LTVGLYLSWACSMPRFARFHVTGGLFHVISRFHDRRFYLDISLAFRHFQPSDF
jgi:hypothetical protein